MATAAGRSSPRINEFVRCAGLRAKQRSEQQRAVPAGTDDVGGAFPDQQPDADFRSGADRSADLDDTYESHTDESADDDASAHLVAAIQFPAHVEPSERTSHGSHRVSHGTIDRSFHRAVEQFRRQPHADGFRLMTDLAVHACRSLCSWNPTRSELDGLPLLACRGCGSQWVRTEPWTPIDHTGQIPDAVRAEVARR